MSKAYNLHWTFDKKVEGLENAWKRDISDYIPLQYGRDNIQNIPPFNVIQWLSTFYGQDVPPLPSVNAGDLDPIPDQRLQQTMEEYQLSTPTVKGEKLETFTEFRVAGFPLIEETRFNIVRSYPAEEQYSDGQQDVIWDISNSYYRAVAWCIYGNWEHFPIVKAQHRTWLNRALENAKHPRHELYKTLNEKRKGRNNLNLKERLGIPYCAIKHEDIQQLTADLYGILLVVFTYQPKGPSISDSSVEDPERHFAPTIRGNFNSPHKFIRLSIGSLPEEVKRDPKSRPIPIWEIYEPMMLNMPAPARHFDFRYVKPNFANTRASLPADANEKDERWNETNHPWRRISGNQPGVPPLLTHPPRWRAGIPVPFATDLTIAIGCQFDNPNDPNPDPLKMPIWIRPDK